MLPELIPEFINPILTLLSGKDIKNVSLCSKRCNQLVAPTLWENVRVTSNRLLASKSVPSHISFARNLCIFGDEQQLTKKCEEKLEALLKLSSPTTLSFFRCSAIVPRCLATISELTGLKNLDVSRFNLSDAGLEHIGRLTGLVNLDISNNWRISNVGLKHLRHLTGLVNLNISFNVRISDAGLKHLHHMTGLVNLNISCCDISDAGLRHLYHLTGLVNLDISHNRRNIHIWCWTRTSLLSIGWRQCDVTWCDNLIIGGPIWFTVQGEVTLKMCHRLLPSTLNIKINKHILLKLESLLNFVFPLCPKLDRQHFLLSAF